MLTQEAFDGLLSWLDPDRERAGEKYEKIRHTLTRRFQQLGCAEPDELANETFDRVARKLPEIVETYKGDPAPYFFSVAFYVRKEHLRRPAFVPLPQTELAVADLPRKPRDFDDDELMDTCLRRCMGQLTERSREMIIKYYRGERQVKIGLRKELAEQLGVKLPNLRLQAQRVRADLKKCILECVERNSIV
ncbi:MAG TPA: sigma-70 family RNA polymerase sigma factor [Pyrinomonadaceae bacterium]|nr:sigma-70 family RNA polymerase sigma factor [Pyrinomonadaceae bacterium]